MKAQEKTGPPAGRCAVKGNKTNGAAGKGARPAKKRKVDTEEEIKSEGEGESGEDAKQLQESLNGLDEEREKV